MTQPLDYGKYYHIYNRGNNRENIFREERNYRYFLELYAKHIVPVADTFAYSLLRNHFHFLIRTKTEQEQNLSGLRDLTGLNLNNIREPSQAFSNLFNAYTKSINKSYQRTGALFERPFGRQEVKTDRYFRHLVIYIHQNPQKHGFVEDFRQWPFSSYPTLIALQKTLLQRDDVLAWFGNHNGFCAAHEQIISQYLIRNFVPEDPD